VKVIDQRYTDAKVSELVPHPGNPRQGDVGAIHQSIESNGFYGALIVQKGTGYVLAGNHRLEAAKASGAETVPVLEIDVDETTAKRIMLADNRTQDLATYDQDALIALLQEVAPVGLDGTGYDGDDLDDLLASYEEAPPLGGEVKNTDRATDMETLMERYKDKATRTLIIELPLESFMWAVEAMAEYREGLGLHDNSEAVLRLLSDALGRELP